MPRFTIRMRTRSPSFTTIGVVAGPALPLIVSQLNSIASVFGMVLFGRMAHSWNTSRNRDRRAACRPLRMNDEEPDHAHHLLHRHVRVVEERAVLVERELVGKCAARRDRILRNTRHAIHLVRNLEAMPVHRERFGQSIRDDEADTVTLDRPRSWGRACCR